MNPSDKCCNNTNNNVINTLSYLKLHVESIPVQHLGSIWVWELVQGLSNLSIAVIVNVAGKTTAPIAGTWYAVKAGDDARNV